MTGVQTCALPIWPFIRIIFLEEVFAFTSSAIFAEVAYLSSPAILLTVYPLSANAFCTSLLIEASPPTITTSLVPSLSSSAIKLEFNLFFSFDPSLRPCISPCPLCHRSSCPSQSASAVLFLYSALYSAFISTI